MQAGDEPSAAAAAVAPHATPGSNSLTGSLFVPDTSKREPVKLDHLQGKSTLRGLLMARLSELEKECAKWFPVASAVDALVKLKPEAPQGKATYVVTLHNYSGFVHVVRALAEVLSDEAVVWLAALEGITDGIDLETRAWSEAMKYFDVAGKCAWACPINRHCRFLPASTIVNAVLVADRF